MRILHFIAAMFVFIATPAMAKDAVTWVVAQKSGRVQVVRAGMQPASVQLNASLSPGDVIATGADGRAMLTHGDDYVIVAPGSQLLLPREKHASGFTRLIQQVGTMLYKVRHTGVPHFAVETPMLAAVVKGTKFTVVVDKDRAAVQVTEGVVEVSSAVGDSRRLVEGGMTVYVGRERPNQIIEMKAGAAEPLAAAGGEGDSVKIKGSGDVPLSAITNLTGGLVSEAPVVATAKTTTVDGIGVQQAVKVTDGTVTSVVDPAVDVVEDTVTPVVEPVTDAVDTVVAPVVGPVVDVVDTVVAPVVEPVVDVVEVVAPVVTPVVTPVVEVVAPVVTPVVEVVAPVVTPVVEVVAPVVTPVVQVVAPVVAPVVNPVLPIVGSLFGH